MNVKQTELMKEAASKFEHFKDFQIVDFERGYVAALDIPCEQCGRDLYQALVERYPKPRSIFIESKLPAFPTMEKVTMTKEQVQNFNSDFSELVYFAAWVCDVAPEKFNRSDMMKATGAWAEIARRTRYANDGDL